MTTSIAESRSVSATSAATTDDTLTVELVDGRAILVPLAWYPQLLHGSALERGHWRLIGQGSGLHWPDLDEDISVENLLDGRPSGESQRSLQKWLARRSGQPLKLTKTQSILPEGMETITISSLMENETAYVVAWAIIADEQRRLWIRGDYSFTRQPQGTSHVKITRLTDHIEVDRNTIGNHDYQVQPVDPDRSILPVLLR